ncbi:MAG TPA: DUF1257 domain-containing protein [Myxococcales bacterium]|nr:DUF1257 domain-containing protein [Myxococcales bacterium]
MSHFTTVKTKINDLVCLKRALKDLDIAFTEASQEQKAFVKGYQGDSTQAQMSIHISKTYDVGVKVDEQGNVEFVADWWGVETTRGWDQEEFQKKVTKRYSYHKVMQEVANKGYTLESEEVQEDQTIQVRVRTWR